MVKFNSKDTLMGLDFEEVERRGHFSSPSLAVDQASLGLRDLTEIYWTLFFGDLAI